MAAKRKPMSEINVVPYIDVMLVLLVIFMATAPLLTQGVIVDLPKAPSKPVPGAQEDPLIVSMRSDGALFLNIGISIFSSINPDPFLSKGLKNLHQIYSVDLNRVRI